MVKSANQMIELMFNYHVSRISIKLCKIPEYATYPQLLVSVGLSLLRTNQSVIFPRFFLTLKSKTERMVAKD